MQKIWLALILLLVACKPEPARVTSQAGTTAAVAFYPSQSGAIWQYLKDGETTDTAPYYLRIEGPQSYNNQVYTGMRFIGRGQDIYYFRQFNERGVYLIAQGANNFYELIYEQPILEYPPQKELVVGKTWSGTTLGTLTPSKQAPQKIKYTYQFRVVSKEKFRIGTTDYDAYLILRDNRIEDLTGKADPVIEAQRIRFVPYIGEVQTREGLVLYNYNFKK